MRKVTGEIQFDLERRMAKKVRQQHEDSVQRSEWR